MPGFLGSGGAASIAPTSAPLPIPRPGSAVAPASAPLPSPAPGGPDRNVPMGLRALLQRYYVPGLIQALGQRAEESGKPQDVSQQPGLIANPELVALALQVMQQIAAQQAQQSGIPPATSGFQRF